jgi:hypothetical protein
MDKQQILALINEMIKDHEGIDNAFHVGAINALNDLYNEIINR